MTRYTITNVVSGHCFGTFEAASESDALDVMAREAGYANYEDAANVYCPDPVKVDPLVVSKSMTFEEFVATRRFCADLGEALDEARWEDEPPGIGFIYNGCLYIEIVQEHWPEKARTMGAFHLCLNRDEWISDNLKDLEGRLFEYARDEGFLNT